MIFLIIVHHVFQPVIYFRPFRIVKTVKCAYKILMDCSLPSSGCRVQSLHSVDHIIIENVRSPQVKSVIEALFRSPVFYSEVFCRPARCREINAFPVTHERHRIDMTAVPDREIGEQFIHETTVISVEHLLTSGHISLILLRSIIPENSSSCMALAMV